MSANVGAESGASNLFQREPCHLERAEPELRRRLGVPVDDGAGVESPGPLLWAARSSTEIRAVSEPTWSVRVVTAAAKVASTLRWLSASIASAAKSLQLC